MKKDSWVAIIQKNSSKKNKTKHFYISQVPFLSPTPMQNIYLVRQMPSPNSLGFFLYHFQLRKMRKKRKSHLVLEQPYQVSSMQKAHFGIFWDPISSFHGPSKYFKYERAYKDNQHTSSISKGFEIKMSMDGSRVNSWPVTFKNLNYK